MVVEKPHLRGSIQQLESRLVFFRIHSVSLREMLRIVVEENKLTYQEVEIKSVCKIQVSISSLDTNCSS